MAADEVASASRAFRSPKAVLEELEAALAAMPDHETENPAKAMSERTPVLPDGGVERSSLVRARKGQRFPAPEKTGRVAGRNAWRARVIGGSLG
jgi:hypothetical protein